MCSGLRYNAVRTQTHSKSMPVFQFQCNSCSALMDHWGSDNVQCLNCGSDELGRTEGCRFYPNKNFCPHDKKIEVDDLLDVLSGIMSDKSKSCAGCGVDGPEGNCSKGGCGGNCTCRAKTKIKTAPLKLNIYDSVL